MTRPRWARLVSCAAAIAAGLASASLVGVALAASGGYDGGYHGEVTLTRGDEATCGKASYPTTFSVVNGQFSIVYNQTHHVGVNLTVADDGSFSGSQQYNLSSAGKGNGTAEMLKASGHIAGNVLDADIEGRACARHYHLTKTV
jgi:hypothetical protein